VSDPGLDGLSRVKLMVYVARARLAHPSLLPPPSADVIQMHLDVLKAGIAHGGWADDRPPGDGR
jgi:hypothetical protein